MSFKFFPILQTLERKAVFLREKRKRKKESFCSFRFQNAARFVFAIIITVLFFGVVVVQAPQ